MTKVDSLKPYLISLVLLAALGCGLPGLEGGANSSDGEKPVVAISNLSAGKQLVAGQAIEVQSASVDVAGITRVELVVNGQVIWVDANIKPEPDTPFIVSQPWVPDTPGRHTVQAIAYNPANEAGESKVLTVEVVADSLGVALATGTPQTAGSGAAPSPPAAAGPETPTVAATASLATLTPSPRPTTALTATPAGASATAASSPTFTPPALAYPPTGLQPTGRFAEIWAELGSGAGRLGYPSGPEIADRNYAKQFFEKGLMIWWDSPETPNPIWVLGAPADDNLSGAVSHRYVDTWHNDADIACAEAYNGGPIRGFGKVWCDRPELQRQLGLPIEPEGGSGGRAPYAHVQFFQGGAMIYLPLNKAVYVLFAQGDWQRFDY